MLLSTALTELRDTLADPATSTGAKQTWTDAELIRHLSRQCRGMYRKQSSIDSAFHNCDINLLTSKFQQIGATSAWDYRLPEWVERIVNVWFRQASTTEDENPYRTLNGAGAIDTQPRTKLVPQSDMRMSEYGWRFHTRNTMRLLGFTQAEALCAQVAKLPASLTMGTIDYAHASTSKFYLVAGSGSDTKGLNDLSTDAYRNATFQFASSVDSSTILTGLVRRCVGSKVVVIGGASRVEIQLDEALPRALATTTDTYEMHLEIPESASRLAILLAARAAMEKKHMLDGIKSILGELGEQEAEWARYISPRELQEPKFKSVGSTSTRTSLPADVLDSSYHFL